MEKKATAENTVREIRRKTRRRSFAEEKIPFRCRCLPISVAACKAKDACRGHREILDAGESRASA